MKKLISLALALMLVFSLATVAMAADVDSPEEEPVQVYTDQSTVTLTKVYKLVGAGSSPAETFTVAQTGKRVVTGEATVAPDLGTITGAEFAAGAATTDGATGTITINLPTYTNVGIYEYTLQEVNTAATAGVTYRANSIRLVVSVINDENGNIRVAYAHAEEEGSNTKSNTITNTYSAGTLKVSKTVDGNMGDKTKYFEFTVTLTGENGKTYANSFPVSGGSTGGNNPTSISLGTATKFNLKHGDTISIANIPYGVSYQVVETAADGYTTVKTGDTGTIGSAEATAAFTNTKNGDVDTGITLDSLPFVLILAVCAGAVVLFVIKRRRSVDF